MEHHIPSASVGVLAGMGSIALPDGVTSWLGKLALGVVVALLTGFVHGLAQRFAAGKKSKGSK